MFRELPISLPHEGGSCTQVWKTGEKEENPVHSEVPRAQPP